MANALEVFNTKIANIYEVEYGDFKRKVGCYLKDFQTRLKGKAAHPEVTKAINEIKLKVIYQPQPDIDGAKEFILATTKKIKAYVN
jgi:hypothetical protein